MSAELTEQEQYWLHQALGSHRMGLLDQDGFAKELGQVIAARLAAAVVEWSSRANEGLDAAMLAAKAEAWDEGYRHAEGFGESAPTLADNPYREATP